MRYINLALKKLKKNLQDSIQEWKEKCFFRNERMRKEKQKEREREIFLKQILVIKNAIKRTI